MLIEKFIAVLHSVKHKILSGEISANVLADLVIVDWSALWTELSDTLDANSTLISEELVQKIATFGSQKAILYFDYVSDSVSRVKANETILKTIAIDFPPVLLEKDVSAQRFEGMF